MQHFTLSLPFLFAICLQTTAFITCPQAQGQLQLSLATSAAPKAFHPSKRRRTTSRPPPRLPSGAFAPKQSLGQNFLSDAHYAERIVDQVDEKRKGETLVEVGPGIGALTDLLYPKFPKMTAIEADKRAIDILAAKMPQLSIVHQDVLETDWAALAEAAGSPLNVIGNLPYYITSQILFSFADAPLAIREAIITTQLEVAKRLVAPPSCKDYGILSVVFQLYCKPKILFQIPPTVFYPKPKVQSALVRVRFKHPKGDDADVAADDVVLNSLRGHEVLGGCHPLLFRKVLTTAFQQRRKMLRSSLRLLCRETGAKLPDKYQTLRADQLSPKDYVNLVLAMYGKADPQQQQQQQSESFVPNSKYASLKVWRASQLNINQYSSSSQVG